MFDLEPRMHDLDLMVACNIVFLFPLFSLNLTLFNWNLEQKNSPPKTYYIYKQVANCMCFSRIVDVDSSRKFPAVATSGHHPPGQTGDLQ